MSNDVYYTYIVQCADGTYYTGKTRDLMHRLKQHNGELSGGARYTKTRRPVVLKYFETYMVHNLAFKREFEIKKYSHNQKMRLCQTKG
jgi:putative endonuclease